MSGKRQSGRARPRIDAAAKVAMLAALREGRRLADVAAAHGVTLQAFHSARRRDPVFAAAWRDAHAVSAERERRRDPREEGEERIVPNNRRRLQRRKMRHVRFDERRKAVFLTHFAWSCDLAAAAAAAGVCENTVYNHRRRDPAFAKAFQAALEAGHARLEAEALRQRLEAQQRLGAALDAAAAESRGSDTLPIAAVATDFDRTMKLLARWDRRGGGTGPRTVADGRRKRWTFDEAIEALDQRLRNLGIFIELSDDSSGPDAG